MITSSHGIEDLVIEEAFIGGLVRAKTKFPHIVSSVPKEALIDKRCNAFYQAVQSLYNQGLPLEKVSLSNELLRLALYANAGEAKGVEYFFDEFETTADPNAMGRLILDMHSRRLEIDLADLIEARAYDRTGDNDLATRLSLLQRSVQELQRLALSDEKSLNSEDFETYYDNLLNEREAMSDQPRMRFKWPSMNKLSPALVPGDFIAIVAESGAGKTSFLEDLSEYWWSEGWHGIYYHLELSLQKMADRRMARQTGLPLSMLQDGRPRDDAELMGGGQVQPYVFLTDSQRNLLRGTIQNMKKWPGSLTLKHCPNWTMAQIVADARHRALTEQVDFVMLDYFNKVRLVSAARGSYVTFDRGQDIELFKGMLEELGVVGAMAAQFGKGGKGSSAGFRTVANARETGELDDKSNIGIVLDRPFDEDAGKRLDLATIYITKCNAGREGKVITRFDGPRYRYLEVGNTADPIDF